MLDNRWFYLALAACTAAVVVLAGVWLSGIADSPATADTRSVAVCDTVVELPADSTVQVRPARRADLARVLSSFGPRVELPEQAAVPDRIAAWLSDGGLVLAVQDGDGGDAPAVYLDAVTGEPLVRIGNGAERARVDPIAASARAVTPGERGWPYNENGVVTRSRISDVPGMDVRWREPDPTSGLVASRSFIEAATPDGKAEGGVALTLANCRSTRVLSVLGDDSAVVTDTVDPADTAAFDAFFAAVEVTP